MISTVDRLFWFWSRLQLEQAAGTRQNNNKSNHDFVENPAAQVVPIESKGGLSEDWLRRWYFQTESPGETTLDQLTILTARKR